MFWKAGWAMTIYKTRIRVRYSKRENAWNLLMTFWFSVDSTLYLGHWLQWKKGAWGTFQHVLYERGRWMRAMAIKVQLKGGHNKKEEKKILTYFYLFLLLSFCLLSGLSLPIYESQHEQVFLKTQKHVLSLQCTLFQKFIFGTKIILDRKSQCEHTLAKYFGS